MKVGDQGHAPAGPPKPAARRRVIDTAWHPLASGHPPAWASAWGQDKYGVYVEFTIDMVSQRLRWIPPGQFFMGSPEGEAGRLEREGPQREVTVFEGFWLFDRPCTQALWETVMGGNPSEFKSWDRPVEQVSWEDVQGFLRRINARVPGLDLVMPSEAQWEYACRAGTTTATYVGNLEILGENNAPTLDAIAWYGGNSGIGFELENGSDSSNWPEKQYEHTRAGTRPVAAKKANPWGLYDMLGNVWEWCADHWHSDYQGAPDDGRAWLDADAENSAGRVFRGGSWNVGARLCRAAFRVRVRPESRVDILGFRPARGQA